MRTPAAVLAASLIASSLAVSCGPAATPARGPTAGPDTGATPTQPPASPLPLPAYPPPTFRLPGDVVPTAARVELTIVPTRDEVPGRVAIDAQVRRATRIVWLHAVDITIAHATLGGAPARVVPGGDTFVGLTLDRELPPGPLAIEAEFTAKLDRDKSRGMYAVTESGVPYVYTFFESTDARRAFPCFDEPGFKIPWQLTFHVPHDDVALGNAPIASERDEPGGMRRVQLAPTRPLPSYLVAYVVGPFEVVDDGTAGRAATPVRFIVPRGRAGELGYAKRITPKIVAALEDYFDMPYPYVKLDVAVVPRYWGTMEHPGLLAMGQTLTLIRPDAETRDRREGYANIAAHELSHYWFGDYVTLAWWNDTWLNEAMGEWLDAIITDAVEPSWRFELRRVQRATHAMSADETAASPKIRQPVDTAQDIEAAFDAEITYLKGSSVMRMFEAAVGHDRWRAFLRDYVRAHADGTATADDMFAAARTALGPEVEAGLRSFVEQPGVPRIEMKLACEGGHGRVALHQSRALPAGVKAASGHAWTVPVCVRFGGGAGAGGGGRACVTLAETDGTLELPGACPTWLLPNAGGTGYYRSALPGMEALLAPGSPAHPTAAEKLMLMADVRAAVDRDEIPVDHALALARTVARDPDPAIAIGAFTLAAVRIDALEPPLRARGEAFEVELARPVLDRLGWARRPSDSDDVQELRAAALAYARYSPVLAAHATALATAYLDGKGHLDDDVVAPVLAAAAAHGNAALFDKILARARAPRDRTDADRMIGALGAFGDPALIDRALEQVRGHDLDLRESSAIVTVALAGTDTRPRALAFLEAHLDELLGRMRDDEASWLLGAIVETPCDAATRDRAGALATPRAPHFSGAGAAVTRGLARSGACIETFQRQLPALTAFLSGSRRASGRP